MCIFTLKNPVLVQFSSNTTLCRDLSPPKSESHPSASYVIAFSFQNPMPRHNPMISEFSKPAKVGSRNPNMCNRFYTSQVVMPGILPATNPHGKKHAKTKLGWKGSNQILMRNKVNQPSLGIGFQEVR